jgi:hypothetical protein
MRRWIFRLTQAKNAEIGGTAKAFGEAGGKIRLCKPGSDYHQLPWNSISNIFAAASYVLFPI